MTTYESPLHLQSRERHIARHSFNIPVHIVHRLLHPSLPPSLHPSTCPSQHPLCSISPFSLSNSLHSLSLLLPQRPSPLLSLSKSSFVAFVSLPSTMDSIGGCVCVLFLPPRLTACCNNGLLQPCVCVCVCHSVLLDGVSRLPL